MRRLSPRLLTAGLLCTLLMACQKSPEAVTGSDAEPSSEAVHETYSAEAFFQNTSFSMAAPSPFAFSADTGDLLITSDETGVFNAYRLNTVSGVRTALTSSQDSPIFAVSWFPSDDRFLFTQDGGGDELTHVFVAWRVESP